MSLKPNGPVPLYLQLKTVIASRIAHGKLRPHDKLPSERELCKEFGISRMTVRQAINILAQEGLVYTQPGKGIFVAESNPRLELSFTLTGYSEETSPVRGTLSSSIINAKLIQATADLMVALGLTRAEELIVLERLRSVRGEPIAFQTVYIPHRLCPGFLNHDLLAKAPLEIVHDEYGLRPIRAEQVIKAGLSSAREMEYLQLPGVTPVLILERKTYLDSGEIIELSKSAYRADHFQLFLTLDLSRWSFQIERDGKQTLLEEIPKQSL
ncbi:MAG: GntR family transcriptional regulator [Chloroflexi bacterium]|nr:GntR family transcriptional regulator [Chloroflexota bacterium]